MKKKVSVNKVVLNTNHFNNFINYLVCFFFVPLFQKNKIIFSCLSIEERNIEKKKNLSVFSFSKSDNKIKFNEDVNDEF